METGKTISMSAIVEMEITNEEFMDSFVPTFNALASRPSNPKSGKLKYAIKRTLDGVQKAGKSYSEEKRELFEEHALKDDNGNPKTDEQENYLFETPNLRKECFEKLKKLNAKKIKVSVYPISLDDLSEAAQLSIGQEIALRGFIKENAEIEDMVAAGK